MVWGGQKGKWAVVGAQNMRYDFLKVWGDALRLLCRNMCGEISAHVDGGWAEGLACMSGNS